MPHPYPQVREPSENVDRCPDRLILLLQQILMSIGKERSASTANNE